MNVQVHKIPQGTLKILDISSITWDKRYRADLGNISDLADSIREKGILQPITVSTDMVLLAGERRIRAALEAGLTKIPALVRKLEGVLDLREIELMENVFRKNFTWDEECALVREIDKLYKANNVEWSGRKTAQLLDKGVGSVSRMLQLGRAVEAIPELRDYKTADEAFKVLKKMEEDVVVDELAKRQRDRLTSTDSLGLSKGIKAMLHRADRDYRVGDVFKGLAELPTGGSVGKLIELVECDPPYGIDLGAVKSTKDSPTSNVATYNEVVATDYIPFLNKLGKELYRVTSPNAWLIFWFGPTWWGQVKSSLTDAGWTVDDIPAIWVKEQGQTLQPEINLGRAYEPFFVCRKGRPMLFKRGRLNVFNFSGESSSKKYHPTQRPMPLMEELLSVFGVYTTTVLVPFLGSGTTIRAAYKCGMQAFGWDISGEYKNRFLLELEEDAKHLGEPE